MKYNYKFIVEKVNKRMAERKDETVTLSLDQRKEALFNDRIKHRDGTIITGFRHMLIQEWQK